ncbi:T9SS type A sorting domain-containing protein [Parafilimonas terrae]|uniref:Secretion system C-terminal sorting domain-containing protein n=1 Tax=Parafilimonas terrae TaxID=1465490 RepID=A0A1I5ZF85_9BACT|nr:T9SS type A sorting domain-containing protein [Parafilimonas terrae]SFQ55080.1 hypothetical protein SAMN05444277_1221 [Parafilimonas terrae]
MKKTFLLLLLLCTLTMSFKTTAQLTVTLTTATTDSASISQGSTYNVVYAAKMKVTGNNVTVNKIDFKIKGTHDANDLTYAYIYFNAAAPVISGASYLGYTSATYASSNVYSVNISKAMTTGSEGYFIIAVSLNNTASDNKTVLINGKTDPLVFGYSTTPVLQNNQANKAGVLTIQAADITLTSANVTAKNIAQGSTYNVVYAAKMKAATMPVTVNNIKFKVKGTHDANDLTYAYIYYNASAPVISGASYLGYTAATFGPNNSYSVNISKAMAKNEQGFFIIAVSLSNTATDSNTVFINGTTDPLVFGYTTAPNITNSQANTAHALTIIASKITLTSASIAAANINQGSTYNVVYAAKMKATAMPVTVNNIKFKVKGTHDANDLTYAYIYYNVSAPVISGASYLGYAAATFGPNNSYSVNISKAMAKNEQGFFIIAVSLSNTATDNNTVAINGATDPLIFSYTTAPKVTNNQSNNAKTLTIQAPDINLTSASITASNINQGSTYNVVYAAKMKVTTMPAVVNKINFTLSGNHDANDLTYVYLYYNAAAPVISGASYLGYASATFAAPHDYSVNISKSMDAGSEGYFIIAVSVSNTANDNRTIIINGLTDPLEFGYTTAPNVTNNQTNKAGKKTIQAADITLTTPSIAAGNIAQGSTYNVVYATKMNVTTMPVTVNNMQFTLSGNHDANDLTYVYLYYNASAPVISGASYLGYTAATYAAPHNYSVNISKAMAVGDQGYFIIAVSVNASATVGKTIKVNGATDPVIFGYATNPNTTNNQANNAGAKTIAASFAPVKDNEANNAITVNYEVNKVFPNPASSAFSFSITGKQKENITVQLTNRSGNIVFTKRIEINNTGSSHSINVSAFPNGVYYFSLINNEGVFISQQQINVQH